MAITQILRRLKGEMGFWLDMLKNGLIGLLFLTNLLLAGAGLALGKTAKFNFKKYEDLNEQILEVSSYLKSGASQNQLVKLYSSLLTELLNDLDNLVLVEYLLERYITQDEKDNYAYLLGLDFETKKKILIFDFMRLIAQMSGLGVEETKGLPEDLDLLIAQAYDLLEQSDEPKKYERKKAVTVTPDKSVPSAAALGDLNNLVFIENNLKLSPVAISYEYLITTNLADKLSLLGDLRAL